ncbi:MAG: hypothetical protein AAF570_02365 [Bacteroidota bacterium]
MYREFIQRKFPGNEKLGLYVSPNLPGSKLGKILMKETRVQPSAVVAMYLERGFFSNDYFFFTDTHCHWPGGQMDLQTLRAAKADGKRIELMVSGIGTTNSTRVNVGNAEIAKILAKVLDDLAYHDPDKEKDSAPDPKKYAAYEGQAIDWLLLRDEVMRTIDMLHERFQDGKLSLMEYENKKTDLLSRL